MSHPKKELKDSIEIRHKLEQQRASLVHHQELAKVEHEYALIKATGELHKKSKDSYIKRLEAEITTLQTKARQYDNIASTGIKSLISMNAFQKRASSR